MQGPLLTIKREKGSPPSPCPLQEVREMASLMCLVLQSPVAQCPLAASVLFCATYTPSNSVNSMDSQVWAKGNRDPCPCLSGTADNMASLRRTD